MKIGLTYDVKTDWQRVDGDPIDANAEFDKPETIDRIETALKSGGHQVKRIGNVRQLLPQLPNLGVDIVFNISEGVGGRNRESQVPLLLEMHGIPFIGADALALGATLDKVVAKKLFLSEGIPTPRFFVATPKSDLKKLNTIGYPLIVKTRHEGTSKGLTNQSVVRDEAELRREVKRICEQYNQTPLVEEFIRGMEFTVPVLGNDPPQAMPVAQVRVDGDVHLKDRFFTFEMVSYGGLDYVCPAQISNEFKVRLQTIAVQAYKCVECRDFGRVDFRVDEKGNPYVLEINPLPSLAKNDVFSLFPAAIGKTFEQVLNQIVDFGLERYGMKERSSAPFELSSR